MATVTGLSLLLLIYVGHGEAKRTYQQFQIEKLIAQGQILQTTLDTFLRGGYAIKQFVGFATKAAPILASDDSIAGIAVYDRDGQKVFASGEQSIPLLRTTSILEKMAPIFRLFCPSGTDLRTSAA